MPTKRSNLSQALRAAASTPRMAPSAAPAAPPAQAEPKAPVQRAQARVGKKAIAGFFDEEVSLQLKQVGLKQRGTSVQSLLAEALNLLFEKHGFPPIAHG